MTKLFVAPCEGQGQGQCSRSQKCMRAAHLANGYQTQVKVIVGFQALIKKQNTFMSGSKSKCFKVKVFL